MVTPDTSNRPYSESKPLGSVVIPAHNEDAVIERCLDALFTGIAAEELDVIVVCNGCTDDTAERARQLPYPVRVLELERAHKPAALRAGDAAALVLPRLYLDADVVLPGESARRVLDAPGRRSDRGTAAASLRQQSLVRDRPELLPRAVSPAGGARRALGSRRLRTLGGRALPV